MNQDTIQRDLAFAIQAAADAGTRALSLWAMERWEGRTLADVGDQACDGYLQGLITGRYPDDGLLSEETVDSPARLARDRAWIVDPLDGTKEYGQMRQDWAVHVALTSKNACSLAAVALPAQNRLLWGVCEPGFEDVGTGGAGTIVRGDSPQPAKARIAVSRSHTPEWVERFIEGMGGEPAPAGSAGNKVAMLLTGDADVYVHKVGLKEWDTCAPETVARAAGWHVCKLRGEEHAYNQEDPYNHELVVCRPAARERVLEVLAECGALEDRK
ncbi:MAG: 3'(2'),5'-bisphosphate nucleotidase CysQ [bacterium]|nr:3'(2'),5'-bisphosphate nucleotidase CysQ [bacterium]